MSCLLTSASLHDSQAAIPLAQLTAGRVQNLYDLMDSAYDAEEIRACSRKLGHVPLIDSNPRRDAHKKAELQREALAQHSIRQLPPQARRYHERSTVQLVPCQRAWCPLALRFTPLSQAVGRSASNCSSVMDSCRSSRPASGGSRCLPLRGRPSLRFALICLGLRAACSHPAMALESGETCPAKCPCKLRSTNASCNRPGNSLAANSANAREKVASLGSAPARSQPHSRRSCGSCPSRSTCARMVGTSDTALASKGRASAALAAVAAPSARTPAGQPGLHAHDFQHLHHALVALAEQAEFLGQPREQLALERQPIL